jgi:hypothetical protein
MKKMHKKAGENMLKIAKKADCFRSPLSSSSFSMIFKQRP